MSKKYIAVRCWDDTNDEEELGIFDTMEEAEKCIAEDFEDYATNPFLREHVMHKIREESK